MTSLPFRKMDALGNENDFVIVNAGTEAAPIPPAPRQ